MWLHDSQWKEKGFKEEGSFALVSGALPQEAGFHSLSGAQQVFCSGPVVTATPETLAF